MKKPARIPFLLATAAMLCGVLDLRAQTPPTITTQPASQAAQPGGSATFSVGVSGTGPFSYQWQLNGTNLPVLITTVAGNGTNGYSGDGGAATNAKLSTPTGVAVDALGNLFIADANNNCIRQVGTNGSISTVAGSGGRGYAGDGGAAVKATLYGPSGVAVDGFGDLFIADTTNNRIRMVGTNGIITTIAGNQTAGYAGDGGAATNSELHFPAGVAVDGFGDLFIADQNNNRIREIGANGTISKFAGNGTAGYSGDGGPAANAELFYPIGVAVDAFGNVLIGDLANFRLRKVQTNGNITTVAGNGKFGFSGDGVTATNTELNLPRGVAVDGFGNLFIADSANNRIRMVGTNGIIATVAGKGTAGYAGDGGGATNAQLDGPLGVAVDKSGNLYIADSSNHVVREVVAQGPALALANVGANVLGNYDVVVTSPYGSVTSSIVTLAFRGPPVIISQPSSQSVLSGGKVTFTIAASGTPPLYYFWCDNATNLVQSGTNGQLNLNTLSTNNAGSYTVVVSNTYGRVTSAAWLLNVGFAPSIALQPASHAVLAGCAANISVGVSGTGPLSCQWQFNGTNLPPFITTVAGGGTSGLGDGGAATNANLSTPNGIAVDNLGNLVIADTYNNRIRRVGTNGVITTVAGNGTQGYSGDGGAATNAELNFPDGVAVDGLGNLFIADSFNNCIRKVGANGVITTVAGNGVFGYFGDGWLAADAELAAPAGLAMDSFGNLFIADRGNNRVRILATNGIIYLV